MMCENGMHIDMIVPVDKRDSHTGRARLAIKSIDFCITSLVSALNEYGIKTRSSCCGHGKRRGTILLQDGRTLIIAKEQKK